MECGTDLAFVYFLFFQIVVCTMTLNLFVAVVLEGYKSTNKEQSGGISFAMLNELVETWVEFDPEASGWISVKDLIFLVFEVKLLGKRTLFETEVKEQLKLKLEELKRKNKSIENRFVVNEERDMVVPFNFALDVL